MARFFSMMVCFGLTAFAMAQAQLPSAEPLREWQPVAGAPFQATVQSLDGVAVTLRLKDGRRWSTPVAGLSEADQAYLTEWQKRQPIKVVMPETAGVDIADLTIEELDGERKGGIFVYRTPHFEFEAEGKFTQKLLKDVAKNFEATFALLKALPWGIEPHPTDGRYRARLFRYRQSYEAVAPKNSGGVYQSRDRMFLVPFDSIGLKVVGKSFAQDDRYDTRTLVHELTHQMMHDWLNLLPPWVIEGTAEYTANLPLSNGRFRVSAAKTGLKDYLEHLKDTRYGVPRPYPLDQLFPITNQQWMEILAQDPTMSRRLYFTAYLLVYYFMHLDGAGDGQQFIRYFREVDTVRRQVMAYEEARAKFLKLPEVEVREDGSYRWPSTLQHPEVPPVLKSEAAMEEFQKKTLQILLNGRTIPELTEQIRAAYTRLGVKI